MDKELMKKTIKYCVCARLAYGVLNENAPDLKNNNHMENIEVMRMVLNKLSKKQSM